MAERLGALLASHGFVGEVQNLRRLSGGASRETWAFDLVADTARPLILQQVRASGTGSGPGMEAEAALMRAAGENGVPTPEVLLFDSGEALGSPCVVVGHLPGETIARKLLRDDEWATARSRLVGQAGAALARIHEIDPAVAPALREDDPLDQIRALLDGYDEPFPAFELAYRWLAANRPPSPRRTVVHGDFRLGNLMVDHEGLAGVLDWEISKIGDPIEDLGWYCVRAWRFGSALPAGGMGTRDELLDAYEAAGGGRVDPEVLQWWEMYGTLRWGLICVMQAQVHLAGLSRSMELAAIGRRVCENEWDVLGLLPGGELPGPEATPDPPGPELYGRPTAAELVEAIREWIETDVRDSTEGRVSFHTRVAANALNTLERELALAPTHLPAHRARLAALGYDSDEALAAAIRSGELDDRADEVRQAVGASVRAKLEVANPRWLQPDT